MQQIHTVPAVGLPLLDLRGIPREEREAEALRLAAEDVRLNFDLAHGPLLRAKVLRLGEEEYQLLLTVHHLIVDCVCVNQVLMPELVAIYEAFSCSKPSPLPEPSLQYADYAAWQRQRLKGEVLERHMIYWQKQLTGELPILELPMSCSRLVTPTFSGNRQTFVLSAALTDALRKLSQRQGVTLFMTLVAAFGALLFRFSEQDDILLGTTTAGRNRSELEKLMGYFLSTVVMRMPLSGNLSFIELLRRVQEITWDAVSHDEVPLELIAKELQPHRDLSRSPIFRVLFSVQPWPVTAGSSWQLFPTDVPTGAAKFDLHVELQESPAQVIGKVTYRSQLFDDIAISEMISHWTALLEEIISGPEHKLGDFSVFRSRHGHGVPRGARDAAQENPSSLALAKAFMLNRAASEKAGRSAWTALDLTQAELDKSFLAPRNDMELQLTKIVENVLRIQPIGVRDNFFDLGGDSLLAARLFAEIASVFGLTLPVNTLLQAPTVEQLVTLVRHPRGSPPQTSLVAIESRGSRLPLFCAHHHVGGALFYRKLSQRLGSHQPFYGLQARGLHGEPHRTIEEMAADYIREIRLVQPSGPYFLGGYCFGGIVAFEMAQQLRRQGQEVALLALFNPYIPGRLKRISFRQIWRLARRIRFHQATLRKQATGKRIAYLANKALAIVRKGGVRVKTSIWRLLYWFYRNRARPLPAFLRNVPEINISAAKRYVAQTYPGRITLFLSREMPPDFPSDPKRAWEPLALGGVDVHIVPDDHDHIFQESLAEQLRMCLDKAQACIAGIQSPLVSGAPERRD